MSRASLLLGALVLLAVAARAATTVSLDGCRTTCGEVGIPYPFGIGSNSLSTSGANCSRRGFEIDCSGGLVPVLSGTQIQVLNLFVTPRPEARVLLPVAYQCYNVSSGNATSLYNGTVELKPTGVYRISNSSNELFVLGCNTLVQATATTSVPGVNIYYSGCAAYCYDARSAQDGACAAIGCCHVDIPPGLTDNWMDFGYSWNHTGMDYSPCDYAFIVEKGNYTFRASDLTTMPRDKTMPLRLDWAIRNSSGSAVSSSCANLPSNPAEYACVSDHSVCVDSTNGPGYACNCTKGYEGNPYLLHGCKSKPS